MESHMPPTTHGTVSPHLAALHIRGQPPRPYLPLPILCIQGPGANVAIPNSLALSLQAHNTSACSASSPHTTSPPTHPAPNSPLTYGVIRLPAGGSSQNLDLSMWSGTFNWSHTCIMEPLVLTVNLHGAGLAPNTGASHNGPLL